MFEILCAACEAVVPVIQAILEAKGPLEMYLTSFCGLLGKFTEQCQAFLPEFIDLFKEGLAENSTASICKRFEMCP
ncbi:hypothetical protein CRM22_001936 [Opisthorchis felineus]|uniref:Saposin B-type domain-containing protein n=1 Tax=Opisthorchis felineus TaxID=147828 RepID=A0A4S2MES5_OPIFE|nr:hypothetical protein CRM22_001936 [Opisthorchis felineus]